MRNPPYSRKWLLEWNAKWVFYCTHAYVKISEFCVCRLHSTQFWRKGSIPSVWIWWIRQYSLVVPCELHKSSPNSYCCFRRENSFGHGIFRISANGRDARWEWHHNQDSHDTVTDNQSFRRDTNACPNRGAPLTYPQPFRTKIPQPELKFSMTSLVTRDRNNQKSRWWICLL